MRTTNFFMFIVVTAAACTTTDEPTEAPTFEAVIKNVIEPNCTFSSCHAAPINAANLDLSPKKVCDTLVNQPSCLFPDRMRIVPGHPEESFFFHKLSGEGLHETPTGSCSTGTNLPMPFGAKQLPDSALTLVHDWIAAGAQCDAGDTKPVTSSGPSIATLTSTKTAPLAGETITISVSLDKPAPTGGQTVFFTTDSASLSAPLQVSIIEGGTMARFEAYAGRPTSRFTLRATTGDSSKDLVLRVAGLDIGEVMADPIGADDRLQWVKIHNRSSLPLDLSGYQLKAGQANYNLVSVDLIGMIPAGGCVVIGGPTQSGSNSEPIFSQAVDFSPDLPYAGAQAAGFAIFDTGAARVGGVATPVDTMLIGTNNNAQLLGSDAEITAPYCGTPVAGMSALRTGPTSCVQVAMQPRNCF